MACEAQIIKFAVLGWRTLAITYKFLTEDEYSLYELDLDEASNDITHRDEKTAIVFEKIESNLTLIGATGVEDKLQEGCATTIQALRRAGIKVWVLTGDKKETAINISNSCKHFSDSMHKLMLTDVDKHNLEKELREHH